MPTLEGLLHELLLINGCWICQAHGGLCNLFRALLHMSWPGMPIPDMKRLLMHQNMH